MSFATLKAIVSAASPDDPDCGKKLSTNAVPIFILDNDNTCTVYGYRQLHYTVFISCVAWVKLNRLRTGVGQFHSSMHKWGLAPSQNCECGASEQTADHVLTACPIHRAPHGARGLTVLDDETRCWLNNTTRVGSITIVIIIQCN